MKLPSIDIVIIIFLAGLVVGILSSFYMDTTSCIICPDFVPEPQEPLNISNETEPLPEPPTEPINTLACPDSMDSAIVTKIIDGDTLDIQDGTRIRLIGINTPEKGQPCFEEATERLEELVLGKEVCLERDKTDKGVYGRLLRHIFLDNTNINLLLVKDGLAHVYFVSPDTKYLKQFEEAQEFAKLNNGCIWNKSSYQNCIGIAYFHYNAEGNDWDNLNDEYVVFSNTCDFAISLTGWTVKDVATHTYKFPEFTLAPNSIVTLHTGSGTDNPNNLYWNSKSPIWNNDGDTLFLWDKEGKLVLDYTYQLPE